MNINPLHDRIVVIPDAPEEVTAGGILLPENGQERPMRGTVHSVGSGKTEDGKLIPLVVQEGDKIIYGKYSGTEITIGEQTLLIMRESDVFATITENSNV